MKIVQSLWTCNNKNLLTDNFGWLAPEYNLMSWTLSCLRLKEHYNNVVLYADENAKNILIDYLNLPYTEVICNLDSLNDYHPQLWALPKIFIYSLQDEPFLHVDGDVFIWQEFDQTLINSGLIAQNLEVATDYYGEIMNSLESALTYFPEEILEDRKNGNEIHAYNAGIFGGTDIAFFKDYTHKSFEFVKKNISSLSKINVHNFNIFFEQYLFLCMVKVQCKKVNVLIDKKIGDNQYIGFGNFSDVPYKKNYLHLLGGYKRNEVTCNQMAARLRKEYPEYYYKIIALYKKRHLPLRKDYYSFANEETSDLQLNQRKLLLDQEYKSDSLKQNGNCKELPKIVFDAIPSKFNGKMPSTKLADLEKVCEKLNEILKNKFSFISNDFLYARDIAKEDSFEYVFSRDDELLEKELATDEMVEFIDCKNDWSLFFNQQSIAAKEKIESFFSETETEVTLCIVPEGDAIGFSVFCIDSIDMIILDFLKERITISELLNKVMSSANVLSEEDAVNKKLRRIIIAKIKKMMNYKIIKVHFVEQCLNLVE